MKLPPKLSEVRRKALARMRAFTLVELMVSAAIGCMVLAAMAAVMVMATRTVYKNTAVSDAVLTSRKVQEHINREISSAVSQTSPTPIYPTYGGGSISGSTGSRYSPDVLSGGLGIRAKQRHDPPKRAQSVIIIQLSGR